MTLWQWLFGRDRVEEQRVSDKDDARTCLDEALKEQEVAHTAAVESAVESERVARVLQATTEAIKLAARR